MVTSTRLTWLVPASPELAVVVRQKAISRPSGDHDRSEGPSDVARLQAPEVSRRGSPPSAETSQRCEGAGAWVLR